MCAQNQTENLLFLKPQDYVSIKYAQPQRMPS